MAQPRIMPMAITAMPRQKPRSTPAPVETMLEGTGRNTSSASSPAMIDADVHPERCPDINHAPSASNCGSNSRNGMMTAANMRPTSTLHRIRSPQRQDILFVLPDVRQPGVARRHAGARAVIVPHGAPGQRLELLLQGEP